MKKKNADRQKTYYILGALALVLVVAGAYAFSSGDLFQGALPRIKDRTVTDVKKTTTPISKTRLPKTDSTAVTDVVINAPDSTLQDATLSEGPTTAINDYVLTPSDSTLQDATLSEGSTTAINDYVLTPSDATLQDNAIPELNLIESTGTEDSTIINTTTTTSPLIKTVSPITTIQTAPPVISSLTSSKNYFRPDSEALTITYNLEGVSPATILYLVVNDSEGNNYFMKQFTATEDPAYLTIGSHSYVWNGRDYSGNIVSPNGYVVSVYGKKNTDDIAKKTVNVAVGDKDLLYLGAPTTTFPPAALSKPVIAENLYNSATGKYRIRVNFDLSASSGDNEIRMGYKNATGHQYKYWTYKDLPNGKYAIVWDGVDMFNEMINTWTTQDYTFWLYGYEKGQYSTLMDPDDINVKILPN